VVSATLYDPHAFGEDPAQDKHRRYPVLNLDQPLNMCAEAADSSHGAVPAQTVHQTRMIFTKAPFGEDWSARRVAVTAALFPWETNGHHTPVMLMVVAIHPAR
jgi:hypothetical protein